MAYLTPSPGPRQQKVVPQAWRETQFRPGIHSLDPAASIVPFLPESLKIVQAIDEAELKRSVLRPRRPCRPAAGVVVEAPLVSNAKSHPTLLPLWSYVPREPAWCYQSYSKDLYVCRDFPATSLRENSPSCRKAIYEFSDKSRAHLDHIACNSGHLIKSQFCLTYHDQNPTDGEVVKKHLDKWLKSYRRRFPAGSYLWVLEFQERGIPHYHVFLSVPVDPVMQKKMARSWVKITKGSKEQYWWHCRPSNWIPWNMENGNYLMKNYVVKQAQKDVPQEFQNVGRFWGCSRAMHPTPNLYGPHEIANLTRKAVIPWEPAAIRHYFDKVLRRYQEKLMNYTREGKRRTTKQGKVYRWKGASMIRHESEMSGHFKIKNGTKILMQLMNYVCEYGPDRHTIEHAIKQRTPF